MQNAGKIKFFGSQSSREIMSRVVFLFMILIFISISALVAINKMKSMGKPFAGFLVNRRLVVSNHGQYYWKGIEAGLRYPDRLIMADGKEVAMVRDFEAMVRDKPVGTPITYVFNRGEERLKLTIPTVAFTWADLIFTYGVPFVSGIIYFLIGGIVYVIKPDTRMTWAFLLACFSLGLAIITGIENALLNIIRCNLFFAIFIPAAGVHLAMVFPEKKRFTERHPYIQLIPYVISGVLAVPLLVTYPNPTFLTFYRIIFVYLAASVLLLIISILSSFFKKSSTIARQRAKVVMLGASIALPMPALALLYSFFGLTIRGLSIQSNFLDVPIIIFPASIAYAIAKHNLFDVDVYIKRSVGYVLMTAVVGVAYFSLQVIVGNYFLVQILGELGRQVYPFLFALLVVFLFNPINRRVQGVVDKLFYRKKYDYKDTVLSVTQSLTSVLNMDEILKRIIYTLRNEMFLDSAGIVLLEPEKECRVLLVRDDEQSTAGAMAEQCLQHDDSLVTLMMREKRMLTKYDVDEDPRYGAVKGPSLQRFTDLGASVALPLTYQDNVTGILALGYKKSGHFYSREDIELLETLANQGAIAIENAKLADQMKKEETVRTNLSRYLSPQIVDRIVKKDVQLDLGGDRKAVTVLFSDIRNFTAITESRPPDQLVHILNEYFTDMAKIVFDNQGSLDKYIGDAIVAVFGSLVKVEDPVSNAVKAAIEMMQHMPRLNEHWTKEFGFSMDMGIAINTGEVFLGNIGSPERMEFTVIGDTVNVASRFSSLAKAGQILITKETKRKLDHTGIQCRELPPSQVKGKTGKLEVFEVIYS